MQIWATTMTGDHVVLVVDRDDDVQIGPLQANGTF